MTLEMAWNEARAAWERGDFWTAHEWLEAPWQTADEPDRSALGGVILLSAALHQTTRGLRRASRRNFAKALRKLAPLPDRWYGVDLRELEWATFVALRIGSPSLALPPIDTASLGAASDGRDASDGRAASDGGDASDDGDERPPSEP